MNNEHRRSREDDAFNNESFEAMSGDELYQDALSSTTNKRRKYHRHSEYQIKNLESFFKGCAHPDEKQRYDLGKRLGLDGRQVKFWFQNRQTQMKNHLERHENSALRQDNEKLQSETIFLRETIRNSSCTNCGKAPMTEETNLEEAQLRKNFNNVCSFTEKLHSNPIPHNFSTGASTSTTPMPNLPSFEVMNPMSCSSNENRSMYLELGIAAMEELVQLVQFEAPLWTRVDEFTETLNFEEYDRVLSRFIGPKPIGFVSEATRASAIVMSNSAVLVEILMDVNRWVDMFSCSISKASTHTVISRGGLRTRHGACQLMRAEFQVLSPLVPIREANFLRFCKELARGVWVVVDVSIDGIIHVNPSDESNSFMGCRKLPSGCVIQDYSNGQSRVTWVEHTEYDESDIHEICRSMVRTGAGLGANKWVSTLKRQCQSLIYLISIGASPTLLNGGISEKGRRSLLKLAHRMTDTFYDGVSPSADIWTKCFNGEVGSDVRIMMRKSFNNPGEPAGVVLNATSSIWLPISHSLIFEYLSNVGLRSSWDILSNGTHMKEMAFISKGYESGNRISLIHGYTVSEGRRGTLILQETITDESGSIVVYAPVNISAMQVVMNGGDATYIALLPSGLAVVPNNIQLLKESEDDEDGRRRSKAKGKRPIGLHPTPTRIERLDGSILTMSFQVLINSAHTNQFSLEYIDIVKRLVDGTVEKVKAAFNGSG